MDAAARFALIIELLCRAVAARAAKGGFAWIFRGAVVGPLVILLWTRLRRAAARFTALAATMQTEAPQADPRRARSRKPRAARPPMKPALPRRFAWLLGPVPEAACSASQLRHLLADPEMQALIETDPRFGRILRPLCRMLGIRPPPVLRLVRAAPSVAMPAKPGAPPPRSAHAVFPPPVPPAPAAVAQASPPHEQRAPPAFA